MIIASAGFSPVSMPFNLRMYSKGKLRLFAIIEGKWKSIDM